jgi:hypothetical protein
VVARVLLLASWSAMATACELAVDQSTWTLVEPDGAAPDDHDARAQAVDAAALLGDSATPRADASAAACPPAGCPAPAPSASSSTCAGPAMCACTCMAKEQQCAMVCKNPGCVNGCLKAETTCNAVCVHP